MPFTFSHPAIVLPLKKIKPGLFSITGLVIGSMAPDFQYFIQMNAESDFSHTFTGIFLFDLPITFLLAIIFHRWIRNPLIRHFPSPFDQKYASYLSFDFTQFLRNRWFIFTLSALTGIVSHIFWDILFKPEGWIYHWAPSFFSQTLPVGQTHFPIYILIERIESILGLAFITWIFIRQKRAVFPVVSLSLKSKITYWTLLFLFTLLISGYKIGTDASVNTLGQKIIIVISASLIALLSTTAICKRLLNQKQGIGSSP